MSALINYQAVWAVYFAAALPAGSADRRVQAWSGPDARRAPAPGAGPCAGRRMRPRDDGEQSQSIQRKSAGPCAGRRMRPRDDGEQSQSIQRKTLPHSEWRNRQQGRASQAFR